VLHTFLVITENETTSESMKMRRHVTPEAEAARAPARDLIDPERRARHATRERAGFKAERPARGRARASRGHL